MYPAEVTRSTEAGSVQFWIKECAAAKYPDLAKLARKVVVGHLRLRSSIQTSAAQQWEEQEHADQEQTQSFQVSRFGGRYHDF